MGLTFARFVGLTSLILGVWIFLANAAQLIAGEGDSDRWVTAWILASGLAGAIGAGLFMLSLDGPERFRTRTHRSVGWTLMALATLLPTSIRPMLFPMVLVSGYSLFLYFPQVTKQEGAITSV
jgi:hypothetical protein